MRHPSHDSQPTIASAQWGATHKNLRPLDPLAHGRKSRRYSASRIDS
jgi:hypothetical protein